MSELSEIREQFVILLLEALERPVPTIWHVQKEIFIFSKIQPKIQNLFQFVKHYEGPYSQLLQESVKEPIYYDRAYEFNSSDALILLPEGRKIFNRIRAENDKTESFTRTMDSLKLIRTVYDKLSKDELLLLIYMTYPTYIEFSNKYDDLVRNEDKRKRLALNLLLKGLITNPRYEELIQNVS